MKNHASLAAATALVLFASLAGHAHADVVTLAPSRDTTLYANEPINSNGVGEYFFVGQTLLGDERNALLGFDLSSIPAGSTITQVALRLRVSQSPPSSQPVNIYLHPLAVAWGEGSSDAGVPGGSGVLAEPGDATWTHSNYPTVEWTTPGGDYSFTSSATTVVGGPEFYSFASTPSLVADVQGWLTNPASNHGWILLGPGVSQTARRFSSRENSVVEHRPALTVTYTPPVAACPADLDNGSGTGTPDGGVDVSDLLYFLAQFEAGAAEVDLDNGSGTGTPDGGVDVSDLLFFLVRFENGC